MLTSPESANKGGWSTDSYEGHNDRYTDLQVVEAAVEDGSRGDYGPGRGNQGGG